MEETAFLKENCLFDYGIHIVYRRNIDPSSKNTFFYILSRHQKAIKGKFNA